MGKLNLFTEFLNYQARKCHNVMGDGNCMFRAIAHQLYGLDQQHSQLCLTLKEAMERNTKHYEPLWIGKIHFLLM